jgi:hypothetical protein
MLTGLLLLSVFPGCKSPQTKHSDDSAHRSRTVAEFIDEIPPAQTTKYAGIVSNWPNPSLIVSHEGVWIVLSNAPARRVPPKDVIPILLDSSKSDWPYGRVVWLSQVGVVASKSDAVENRRATVELQHDLEAVGIKVELIPSA